GARPKAPGAANSASGCGAATLTTSTSAAKACAYSTARRSARSAGAVPSYPTMIVFCLPPLVVASIQISVPIRAARPARTRPNSSSWGMCRRPGGVGVTAESLELLADEMAVLLPDVAELVLHCPLELQPLFVVLLL